MTALRSYPEYGDETVQLLGRLPKGWRAVPVKVLGVLSGGAGFPHEEQGRDDEAVEFHKVSALGAADKHDYLAQCENTISAQTAKKLRARIFPERTIVFAKVGAALLLSRFRWLRRPACLDNNMMGLEVAAGHAPAFVKHAIGVLPMSYVVNPGAVPSVNEGGVGNLRLPCPPLEEQAPIARFLDYETARIDALIEKQQQLILLLKEKRQAVISHAVTKGLNPDAPLKDSGVEWLGMVPAHWRIGSLKFFATVQGGYAFKSDLFGTEGIPVIRIGDIARNGVVGVLGCKRVLPGATLGLNSFRVGPGDILMAMTGATIGKAGRIPNGDVAILNQRVGAFRRTNRDLEYEFLWHVLGTEAYQEHVSLTAEGGAQPNISDGGMLSYRIALPPVTEQRQIVAYLADRLPMMAKLDSAAADQITLLQERRTALISAAVTGKIDVRGWQPPGAA